MQPCASDNATSDLRFQPLLLLDRTSTLPHIIPRLPSWCREVRPGQSHEQKIAQRDSLVLPLRQFHLLIQLSQDCVRRGGLVMGYFRLVPSGRRSSVPDEVEKTSQFGQQNRFMRLPCLEARLYQLLQVLSVGLFETPHLMGTSDRHLSKQLI